jgi:nicotinic acid mononucleotide adenylyltransferase
VAGWEIVETAHIAVAQRAGTAAAEPGPTRLWPRVEVKRVTRDATGGSIVEFAMTPTDVSATEVRHLLSEPPSPERAQRLSAMVPAVVLDYIDSNRLYRA